jgi:uncharacterized protein YegP (UPF0339 family)
MNAQQRDPFRIYRDRQGEWRWRLRAPNGRTVADSGEGYSTYHAARAAVLRMKTHTATALVPPRVATPVVRRRRVTSRRPQPAPVPLLDFLLDGRTRG